MYHAGNLLAPGGPLVLSARLQLAALWLAQTARIVADWTLRLLVIRKLVGADETAIRDAWHQATAVYIAPFILLAPFNGALSNAFAKRWVLVFSAVGYLGAALVLVGADLPWLVCLGLAATGMAVFSPTRYALLPAAARDTRFSLSFVNGLIEMGGAAAIVVGLILGQEASALALCLVFGVIGLAASLPVHFASDVRREETPGRAMSGFFRDASVVWRDPAARWPMLGLAAFLAVITAGSGAVLLQALDRQAHGQQEFLVPGMLLVTAGVAAGALLAGLQGHIRRGLGLVPLGALGLVIGLTWAALVEDPRWPCLLMGLMGGIVSVPLRAAYQNSVPADARGNAMAISNAVNYVFSAALALLLVLLVRLNVLLTLSAQLTFLTAVAALGVSLAFRVLLRQVLEQVLELLIWPIYRIKGHGPGLAVFPLRGPVLIVANHAAWFDPLWMAKVTPRGVFPMMTSVFFDLPVLHFLMVNIVHAIRVPAFVYRREAPELKDAVAVLDRGQALLIFPEGMMRRKEDRLLRQFGQGVWHILRDRPDTPIICCWIEGGWGSFMSYKGGPPTKNKRMDFWRHIDIAVNEPEKIDPKLLDDHRTTRAFLMRRCLEARKHLGLEVPVEQAVCEEEEELIHEKHENSRKEDREHS